MSFLNTIKRGLASGASAAAHGVVAGAKGVGGVVRDLSVPQEGPALPQEQVAPPMDRPSKGFQLPELDEKDPDYEHRKSVHDAIMALDQQWRDANPDIDYEGHYRQIAAEMKKAPREREFGPLFKLGVALGTQNPDHPYEPNQGLAAMKERSSSDLEERRKDFESNMALKKEALSGHIRQLLDEGKFRQALAQLNASEQMNITKQRQQHTFQMEEDQKKIEGRNEVARINAQNRLDREDRHNQYMREHDAKLKLSPSDAAAMKAEYADLDDAVKKLRTSVSQGMMDPADAQDQIEEIRKMRDKIHDKYEGREFTDVPDKTKPSTTPTTPTRPGGEQWRQAAGG